MLENSKKILRLACLVLVALVIYQVAEVALRINPLARVKIPELPSLPPDTNAPPAAGRGVAATNVASAGGGTNSPPHRGGTNASAGTNAVEVASGTNNQPARSGTNAAIATVAAGTNVNLPVVSTNADMQPARPTNLVAGATNMVVRRAAGVTNTNGAVVLAGAERGTNATPGGTNVVLSSTNAAGRAADARGVTVAGGPSAGPRAAGGGRGINLPPAIQARVDRISESEILGTIIRPPPMALLGIAGEYALLRTATGQTGLVKLGDELGGLKLVRIGTNRVLVEEQGQQKELMIYSGFGGDSLLPKQETPK